MLKTLNEFKLGTTGQIKKVKGERKIRRRLLDMGVTPGTTVLLRKIAPLGDPIEITSGRRINEDFCAIRQSQ